MDIESLKNITDEEKLRIFNISIKIVEETGVDLSEALKTTINKYLENKNNKEEVFGLQGINPYNLSNDELDIIEKTLREESNNQSIELSNELNELKADFAPFWDAVNGKIIDKNEYFSRYYVNAEINKVTRDEIFSKLDNLNSLRRELSYLRVQYYPIEEVKEDKEEEVNSYKELLDRLLENKNEVTDWVETPEVTLDGLFNNELKNGSLSVGSNGALPYDYIYFKTNSYAFHNESLDERIYDEIITKTKEKISSLEQMTIEEYKEYKLSQMMLSEEEKKLFDERINNYLENRDKIPQK